MQNSPPLRRKTRLDLNQAMQHGVWGGLTINLGLIPLFLLASAPLLSVVSLVSASLYVFCLYLLRRRRAQWVVLLTFLEILIHVPIVVVALGWNGGFQYYLLVILPLIFVAAPRQPKPTVGLAALIATLFVALDFYTQHHRPLMVISPLMLDFVRYANMLAAFGLSSYVAWRYSRILLRAERDLTLAANTDPLTGLSNRRYMNELIHKELSRAERSRGDVCFVLADIDNFKAINDAYGHEAGDDLLVFLSGIMRNSVRLPDLVARWGGEEFLLVLPDTGLADAEKAAERIRQAAENSTISCHGQQLKVTMTFGLCQYSPGESLEACLDRADHALYSGKRAGKNRVVIADADQPLPA